MLKHRIKHPKASLPEFQNGRSQFGAMITGAVNNLVLIKDKEFKHSESKLKSFSLTKRLQRGLAIFEKSFIKADRNQHTPRNSSPL